MPVAGAYFAVSSGSGFRFRRFLWGKGFSVLQQSFSRKVLVSFPGKDGSSVPVPLSVPGKKVLTVPVSGSSPVSGPSCTKGENPKEMT